MLELPYWYLVAGCLYQTVWNVAAPVQIRNQARVHLWYEEKFGIPCPPHESTEAAIDTFEATTACLGVRAEPGGRWRVYAPHGLSDVFNLVVRPNPVLAPREVYQAKTARWRRSGRPSRSCPGPRLVKPCSQGAFGPSPWCSRAPGTLS
jgi:uncharacterized protein